MKDEQKAEDELVKKRAAFLQKQQKKAEEARLRKQQLKAESELKRDEARRKAEEERQRKEDEKTRRELIKQEYLRRKQQEMLEEHGLVKPKTPKPKQKHRPKTVLREESSSDNFSKGSSTREIVHCLFLFFMLLLKCERKPTVIPLNTFVFSCSLYLFLA
ncbi:calmodulin-regulated spectrin-associated protein 1-like [Cynoglossus semilaevis]|uniref:calmodulin-regulated spectrin-associated protein 1-like n=1 Tax=Cynoglossus semilaevis TaxID=244447 RepID=UPI000495A5B5|nr:calmodulin-regulated spectrin-associated protein 1-like [Cynoglossus semilaevis]